MNKRMSVAEYSKIAKVGDTIITNADADHGRGGGFTIEGQVTLIVGSMFVMEGTIRETGELPRFTPSWNINKTCRDAWVEVNVPSEESPKKPKIKKKIYITIERDSTGVHINLKIPEEIEEYYKNLSKGEIQQSQAWFNPDGEGVNFYKLNDEMIRQERRIESAIFSDFGNGIMRDESINVAILRTVGASRGIKITSQHFSDVNNIDLEYYVKRLGLFTKSLWETSISKKTVKSILTFEI